MTKPDTKALKRSARGFLADRHAVFAGITLVMTVLNLALNFLSEEAAPYGNGLFGTVLFFACSLLVNIIYYILLAGLYRIYLKLCRGEDFRWMELFEAFREHPEPVAVYSVVQYLISFAFLQVFDWYLNFVLDFFLFNIREGQLVHVAVMLAALVIYIWVQISLSMTLFIHADDPNASFREMISGGWRLMRGVRWRYFYLQLSFLGMNLLALLSFGIGLLFVQPYFYTSQALFYEHQKSFGS